MCLRNAEEFAGIGFYPRLWGYGKNNKKSLMPKPRMGNEAYGDVRKSMRWQTCSANNRTSLHTDNP
jgi:hypothetical protein